MNEPENIMDGSSVTDFLNFYYEQNIVTGIYEFKDEDALMDMFDILRMDFKSVSEGEKLDEQVERKDINYKLSEFLCVLEQDIDNGTVELTKNDIKTLKKERRKLKLLNKL